MSNNQYYNWIFWRHAQAENGRVDLLRPLTEHGQRQAEASAAWLSSQGLDYPIVSSQATRAQQTAAALSNKLDSLATINPGASAQTVLEALKALSYRQMIVVGHQPWIGQVVQQLLTGQPNYRNYSNSDLYWLQSENGSKWIMYNHIANSELLQKH